MSVRGWVQGCMWRPQGSELVATAPVSATVLQIEDPTDFDDDGGILDLNGTQLSYIAVDDDGILTLSAPLATAGAIGDRVLAISGGRPLRDVILTVSADDGDAIEIEVPFSQRDMWPEGDYDDPVQVVLSDDLETIENVPGRTPTRIFTDVDGNVTGYFDSETGENTHIGEFGTAPPGQVGIFGYSTSFGHVGSQATRPVLQFNVGATRDQPSIQADTVAKSGLMLYSGANTAECESHITVDGNQIIAYVEASADSDPLMGAKWKLANDVVEYRTDYTYGADDKTAMFYGDTDHVQVGYRSVAAGKDEGMIVYRAGAVRLLATTQVEVVNQTGSSWQNILASAFVVSSDVATKSDLTEPEGLGLDVIRSAPAYSYTQDGERRIGPLANDLPEHLTQRQDADSDSPSAGLLTVSLTQMIGVLWQAVSELDAEVKDLRAQIAEK